jgi:outer membrane autotransporter protein
VTGGANLHVTGGDFTVGEIRYVLSGSSVLTGPNLLIGAGTDADTATLRIVGAGIRWEGAAAENFIMPTVVVARGSLEFSGNATAGGRGAGQVSPRYEVNSALIFRDNSSADRATMLVRGTVSFLDNARAEAMVAEVQSGAKIEFRGSSDAGNSAITSLGGEIGFSNSSSSNRATIRLLGRVGSNNSKGSLVFRDQAQGGPTSVVFVTEGTELDISGVFDANVAGGAGRAPLTQPNATAAVANDQGSVTLGSVYVIPGVSSAAVYLGGNRLVLGEGSVDTVYIPTLRDTGGRFGSSSGTPLIGGGLTKIGGGVLQAVGFAHDYSGKTQAVEGELRILSGARMPRVHVYPQGSLTGDGTVTVELINQHGWIKPGYENGYLNLDQRQGALRILPASRTGTLRVEGNFTQMPGIADGATPGQAVNGVTYVTNRPGNLEIEFASAMDFDRLEVSGTANLAGTLRLQGLRGFAPVGNNTLRFLTAAAINGRFDNVVNPLVDTALIHSRLVYSATAVSLQIEQRPFADFAATARGTALATHFDSTLAGSVGAYRELIAGLNTLTTGAQVTAALDALAPDHYGVLPENAFLAAVAQQAARDRLFATARDNPRRGFELFFEAGRRAADFNAAGGLPGAHSSLSGGMAGGVWRNGRVGIGAALTQEQGDADLDALGSKADIESLAPTAFCQYAGERYFVSAAASVSRDDYSLRRRVVFTGFDQTATADASGTRTDFSFTVGGAYAVGAWSLVPQAGLLSSRWKLDRFTESGAAGADLVIDEWSSRSLRTRLGVEVAGAAGNFTPRATLVWLHETESDRGIPAAFAGAAGSSYMAPGRLADQDLFHASLGFDWKIGRNAVLHATASAMRGDHSRVTADFSAGFRWSF